MFVYDDILGIYDTAWCPWDEPGSKIKGAKKKMESEVIGEKGEGGRRGEARRNAFYAADPPRLIIRTGICCKTWGSHLAMSTDDRFLPQGSATHTLVRVAYM